MVTPDLLDKFSEINKALDRCCKLALKQPLPNKQIALMTDASFTATGYAVLIEDDPLEKYTSTRKAYAPVAYGSKTFSPAQLKMSIYAKEFLAIFFAFKEFGHIFWGTPKPVIILTDNRSVTQIFQTKIIPPSLWNACDYVFQFNFTFAHIPGKNNTAADYLSRLEISPKEKLILRIREDIPTTPTELHVQSAGVAEEEQIYYTDDDDETEEQIWQRKQLARENPFHQPPDISFEKFSIHHSNVQRLSICQRLTNINTVAIEQSNDVILQQLKLKLQKEEYSETISPEDAMQIDLLPNLPPSGGYEKIITAMDVFSRYLFAYPVTDASAANTAKGIIDIMTKHTYLPTTLITDKGSAFTSKLVAEIAQILGIQIRCATTKHPQTIGKLKRTHASLKTNLKMASGEYRRQWHKYLPLAVLNYNTSYHSTLGCEPSRVFHGRTPCNILDHKLGLNPNPTIFPMTDFAEEFQRRSQILLDNTKKNIMQSYLI